MVRILKHPILVENLLGFVAMLSNKRFSKDWRAFGTVV